jgi:hypothetical protein
MTSQLLITKSTKFEIWIQDPWSTARRPKTKENLKKSHLEKEKAAKPTNDTKQQTKQNSKEEQRKTQNYKNS